MKKLRKRKFVCKEDDILARGRLRSMGFSSEEATQRIVTSKKIKKLIDLRKKFGGLRKINIK